MMQMIIDNKVKMTVLLDIGGTLFRTKRSTLEKIPMTRLAGISTEDDEYDEDTQTFYFDRNSSIFQNILDCYRTGQLHIPPNVCVDALQTELEFWDLPEHFIASCCLAKYHDFKIKQKACRDFYNHLFTRFDVLEETLFESSGIKKLLLNIWKHLEFPYSSRLAKVSISVLHCFVLKTTNCNLSI